MPPPRPAHDYVAEHVAEHTPEAWKHVRHIRLLQRGEDDDGGGEEEDKEKKKPKPKPKSTKPRWQ